MSEPTELTQAQIEQQDHVDGVIHTMLEQLAGKELEHDIEMIGEVRDAVIDVLTKKAGVDEMTFYPYIALEVPPMPKLEWVLPVAVGGDFLDPYVLYHPDREMFEAKLLTERLKEFLIETPPDSDKNFAEWLCDKHGYIYAVCAGYAFDVNEAIAGIAVETVMAAEEAENNANI